MKGHLERQSLFARDPRDIGELRSLASINERWHICEVLFAVVYQVLQTGSTLDEIAIVSDTISNYLESEWEASTQEITAGDDTLSRTGVREIKYRFCLRASAIFLLLLEMKPTATVFLTNLTNVYGNAQACAAWILCTLVNSHSDCIRAIGVRFVVAYLEFTGQNPDAPLSFEDVNASDIENTRSTESRTLQENTMTLISNVGQGFMNTNVGKGLAAIGPTMRSKMRTSPKLTPRVAYKLLWHLLKSHRYRVGTWTQASLVASVFQRKDYSTLFSQASLKVNFISVDNLFTDSSTLNWAWLESTVQDTSVPSDSTIRSELGLNTVIRLLRFLPDQFIDRWLSDFIRVSARSTAVIQALSFTPDWQPCIFQLSSELAEKLATLPVRPKHKTHSKGHDSELALEPQTKVVADRLDLSLELHSILLANIFRQGEEKALMALEHAASLQRVCVNGEKVFLLILTKLFSNLSTFGVLSLDKITSAATASDNEETSILLKRSAKLITDTILSNATKGISMPTAVDCWRCLRHLTAVAVAMSTKLG